MLFERRDLEVVFDVDGKRVEWRHGWGGRDSGIRKRDKRDKNGRTRWPLGFWVDYPWTLSRQNFDDLTATGRTPNPHSAASPCSHRVSANDRMPQR